MTRRRGLFVAVALSLALHAVLGGLAWQLTWQEAAAPAVFVGAVRVRNASSLTLVRGGPRAEPQAEPFEMVAFEWPDPPAATAEKAAAPVGPPPPVPGVLSPAPGGSQGTAASGRPPGTAATSAPAGGPGGGWLPAGLPGRSVVYVLDRSVSMGLSGALGRAREEVCAALRGLPPGVSFQVVTYHRQAETLHPGGRQGLLPVEPALIEAAAEEVARLQAQGGTDPVQGLRCALDLHPEQLVLLTDAGELTTRAVEEVTRRNGGRTVIHVVEIGGGAGGRPEGPLQLLARLNRGTYRRVDRFQ